MKNPAYSPSYFIHALRRVGLGVLSFGALVSTILLIPCPLAQAQGSGTIYVSDYQGAEVQSFPIDGGSGITFMGITNATGLAFDAAGNLFMVSSTYLDPNGVVIYKSLGGTQTPQPWYTRDANHLLGGAHGIVFDRKGNMFIATSSGNTLMKLQVKPNGAPGLLSTFADGSVLVRPFSVALDSKGNVFVTDGFGDGSGHNNGKGTIVKFNPSGTMHQVFAPTFTGFNVPWGLAIDGSDNVYISNNYGNAIIKFNPDGTLSSDTFSSTNLDGPLGLAFDGTGTLYVANRFSDNIWKFSPTGTDLGEFAETGLRPHFLLFHP